jgi:hypothetical protein
MRKMNSPNMKIQRNAIIHLLVVYLISAFSVASDLDGSLSLMKTPIESMKTLAYALGWFMMVIMGLRWIVADSAEERGDAKKGLVYIAMALVVVSSICGIMCIYCSSARTAVSPTYDCGMGFLGCNNCS